MAYQCINNVVPECDLKKHERARVSRPPTWADVRRYFSSPNECFINVIYLDNRNNPNVSRTVKYKKFDTCVEYFHDTGNDYYYVYIRLLRNMLVWSAHPIVSGVQGVIGHHITVGRLPGNQFDIHETMYTATEMKRYHIIATKRKRTYMVDPKTFHLRSMSNPPPHYAPQMWNQILRYTVLGEGMVGGMGQADPRIIITNKNPRPHMSADELWDCIQKRLQPVMSALGEEDDAAFIRIPYVPVGEVAALQKKLQGLIGSTNVNSVLLVSDHHVEYSALGLNVRSAAHHGIFV
jgi:hypothetical protein